MNYQISGQYTERAPSIKMSNMKNSILLLSFLLVTCNSFSQQFGSFTDPRDGKVYKTAKIGMQWIMAENLAYKPALGNY
jgi:hypothetical protein